MFKSVITRAPASGLPQHGNLSPMAGAALRGRGHTVLAAALIHLSLLVSGVGSLLIPFAAVAQVAGPASAVPGQQLLRSEELAALLAPVALYPDKLLAQVLMASTYPFEVVQADRWVTENKNLSADQLRTEADKQAWDESVKSLVAVPSVLTMMSTKLDWTKKLGDAVLAQQADVMDAVQSLRSKAHAKNTLTTTKEQTVAVKQEQNRQIITIEPTSADTGYVPYYDPNSVYGEWPYAGYPPYYFPQPGYFGGAVLATGIAFGAGYALGRYWRAGINWGGNYININRGAHVSHWQHNPVHRHGVAYSNARVRQQFGNVRSGGAGRLDFRGSGGHQVLRPGGDHARVAHHGLGNRPNAGHHGAARNTGATRNAGVTRNAGAGNRVAARPPNRPTGAGGHGRAHTGRANLPSHRVHASIGGARSMGGGFRGGRGGRRSDARLKHDIVLLGRLDNGVGLYRFAYNGSNKTYVGVIAQELQAVMPEAVARGRDGFLKVYYDKIGLKFQSFDQWIASGARVSASWF